jgi:hypothetical protein
MIKFITKKSCILETKERKKERVSTMYHVHKFKKTLFTKVNSLGPGAFFDGKKQRKTSKILQNHHHDGHQKATSTLPLGSILLEFVKSYL